MIEEDIRQIKKVVQHLTEEVWYLRRKLCPEVEPSDSQKHDSFDKGTSGNEPRYCGVCKKKLGINKMLGKCKKCLQIQMDCEHKDTDVIDGQEYCLKCFKVLKIEN